MRDERARTIDWQVDVLTGLRNSNRKPVRVFPISVTDLKQ